MATYDAKSDPNSAGTDPMRTLFVSRLDFSTTESDLYAEFEKHGAIRQLKLIKNPDGKSRGWASSPTPLHGLLQSILILFQPRR